MKRMTKHNQPVDVPMVKERTWKEFRDSGLLWWVNRTLHLFGWVIVVEFEGKYKDDNSKIHRVYPARCRYRGFVAKSESRGFLKLTNYINTNVKSLMGDCKLK